MCLALVSAATDTPLAPDMVVVGEVGLAGEVRQVGHISRRLAEASRLGFAKAIVPMSGPEKVQGISVHRVGSLNEALTVAQLPTA
jgi:DNA repair protein RadA/Sms